MNFTFAALWVFRRAGYKYKILATYDVLSMLLMFMKKGLLGRPADFGSGPKLS